MKKLLLLSTVFLFLAVQPRSVFAAACPSSNLSCTQSNGQPTPCDNPCVLVITQPGGPGGRGTPRLPVCACQMPNTPGSIPDGGQCQRDTDCLPGHYCWGNVSSWPPTCHAAPASASTSSLSPFCNPSDPNSGVNTAIGCVPTDPSAFIAYLLRFAIGVAGGIAFLLILFGGFQMMTSAGNPERLNAGKELISSAITGLLLIIFSVFLLKVVGVDILGIPGFR